MLSVDFGPDNPVSIYLREDAGLGGVVGTTRAMSLAGYARVSTAEGRQVLDRPLDALKDAGCERVFEDRVSGGAPERPNLAARLDYLRQDDVLVVLDPDRLGRRAGELITLIDEIDQRGIGFRALNSPIDTTPAGRAFLQIQAAFAEMERKLIRQRVRENVKAARARGRKGGGPRVMTPRSCATPRISWPTRRARSPPSAASSTAGYTERSRTPGSSPFTSEGIGADERNEPPRILRRLFS